MPKPWPSSDCEFVLRPHEMAECQYHLEVECAFPQHCNNMRQIKAHFRALEINETLFALWQSRSPPW